MRNLFIFILNLSLIVFAYTPIVHAEDEQEISSIIEISDEFYNALPQEIVPLTVTVNFELLDINFVNDEAETFDFTGIMKYSWHDPRQIFDPTKEGIEEKLYMGNFQFNEIYTGWWPQFVLLNESGMYDKHGVMLRIKPNGNLTLIETINATVKTDFNLRRYPYDTQRLGAVFTILGFNNNEIVLKTSSGSETETLQVNKGFRMPQWHLLGLTASIKDRISLTSEDKVIRSTYVVDIDIQRQSFYILRLIVLPMIIIVILSWSVFWMEKSSLGDRINLSFIGILTAVAYQMVIGDILPRIAYFTLMNAFLNLSFLIMCATVAINLRVSFLDREGKAAEGDQLDHRCRWAFPLTYFGLLLVCVVGSRFFPTPN